MNFAEKSVVLNDGRTLTYDKLLIATGAHSVTLDQFSDDTIYIRSIADATRLVAALDGEAIQTHPVRCRVFRRSRYSARRLLAFY